MRPTRNSAAPRPSLRVHSQYFSSLAEILPPRHHRPDQKSIFVFPIRQVLEDLIWEQWAGVSTQRHLSRRYVRAPHIGAIPKEGTRSQTILQLPQKSGVATADACELRCGCDSSGRCHSFLQEVSHLNLSKASFRISSRDSLSPGSTSGSLPVPIHRPALYSAWARSGAVGDVVASRGPHVGSPSRC